MRITPARARWISLLGALVIRVLGRSWRCRVTAALDRRDVIYAFHHGDMLMAAWMHRHAPVAILISHHGDGEAIAQTIERLGYHAVRGSSSRGGARAMLEFLDKWSELAWAITPDGPRGPRGSVAPGIATLAARSGRAIVPAGFAPACAKRLSSWDRFTIPAPFTRVAVCVGDPIHVPREAGETELAAAVERVREQLAELEARANAMLADW